MRSVANATFQDGVDFLNIAIEIPLKSTVQIYELEGANQALMDVKNSQINGEAILRVR